MRFGILARSALPGLCALTFACSNGGDTPTESTAPSTPGGETSGPELSLFGLGAAGSGCRAPQYRQFDFWLGNWEVSAGGPSLSASFITRAVGGCAVLEDWHGAGGSRGRSLNAYDASDHQWHQHWVENSGFYPLRLDGGFRNGAMVMQETYPDPRGTPTQFTDRYTWTRLGPDDTRQFVERSTDGGATFAPSFDGRYHRNARPAVPSPSMLPYCTSSDPGLALFQEFDFTVGHWTVDLDRPGQAVSPRRAHLNSEITKDLDGCLYEESLKGAAGYEARIFSNIRPIDEVWRRTYVDNRGIRIYVTGPRLENGTIMLSGTMPRPGGGTQRVRAIFRPVGPNRFTERWERATRTGWEPILTATYVRR